MERLSPVQEKFILHWGEMGTRWGINRTVAQIHALLYLSPAPLHAEDIARLLSVARSNVSSSLRELQSWGIVRIAHVLGDRRDHFESLKDVWQMFQIILEERKRREVDPTIAMLKMCEEELAQTGPEDSYTAERLAEMTGFFETTTSLYRELSRLPAGAVRQAAKLKSQWRKLLGSQPSKARP
jgi:DNA-binding transcriptional regulator GbsR (MarR family)